MTRLDLKPRAVAVLVLLRKEGLRTATIAKRLGEPIGLTRVLLDDMQSLDLVDVTRFGYYTTTQKGTEYAQDSTSNHVR